MDKKGAKKMGVCDDLISRQAAIVAMRVINDSICTKLLLGCHSRSRTRRKKTMPKYIDADALIEAIKNELWDWQSLDDITATCVLKQTITDIQNAQTADVVERKDLDEITEAHVKIGYEMGFADGFAARDEKIVRCKDCVHRHQTTCPFLIANAYKASSDDDFCNYGERRTNEESPERTD